MTIIVRCDGVECPLCWRRMSVVLANSGRNQPSV